MIQRVDMKRFFKISTLCVVTACVFILSPAQTKAEVTVYTDATEFLEAVAALDLEVTTEGFEDDADWGESRITLADRVADKNVTSNGFTYNSRVDGPVATGTGPVRTGEYGFFALPHGLSWTSANPSVPQLEGFVVDSDQTMYAFGGWFESNVSGSEIAFSQNGTDLIEFDDESKLDYYHKFYGIIDTGGFKHIEVHELEGMTDDRKHIFADDLVMVTGDMSANPIVDNTTTVTPAVVSPEDALVDLAVIELELEDHVKRIGDAPVLDDVLAVLGELDEATVESTGTLAVKDGEQITISGTTVDGKAIELAYTIFDAEEFGKYEGQIAEEDDFTLYEALDDSFEVILFIER
jgi:hypothetical protein